MIVACLGSHAAQKGSPPLLFGACSSWIQKFNSFDGNYIQTVYCASRKKYPSTPCGIKWQLIGYPWLPKQDPPLGFGACSLLIQIFNSFDSHIGKLNPNHPLWKIPTGHSTEHFSPWISCYPKKALAHCQTRFQSHVKFTRSFCETSKVHMSGTLSIIQFDSHSCM